MSSCVDIWEKVEFGNNTICTKARSFAKYRLEWIESNVPEYLEKYKEYVENAAGKYVDTITDKKSRRV